ncbi:hypothetical protein BDQ12DRAFT_687588 [Crucibulum laeve]|uniref:Uncharacterized protein n=1 Tax=Crucibulum laeve TaxID=68775 RepID=A0A5C3LV36_9AGAR|nr:hypothetical protein BDQ12DRAFT_687588 [Crucibulum laeve]
MDNQTKGIIRSNVPQSLSLSVPLAAHNARLLYSVYNGYNKASAARSSYASPPVTIESASRWTLDAFTARTPNFPALSAVSAYSQASWNHDAPIESEIRTDPRRFAIALSPGARLLWDADTVNTPVSASAIAPFTAEVQDSPLSDKQRSAASEHYLGITIDHDEALRRVLDHGWTVEMDMEFDRVDAKRREEKRKKRVYSIVQKRASKAKVFGKVLSRFSMQPKAVRVPSTPHPYFRRAAAPSPPPVPLISASTPPALRLPEFAMSPLKVAFAFTSPSPTKAPSPQPQLPNPHIDHFDQEEYDRFQAMERLKKLVLTPLRASFPEEPVEDPSLRDHALERLRKLRFTAPGLRVPGTGHKRNHSSPSLASTMQSDWDFHDSPLQMLQVPAPMPAVLARPSVDELLRNRSRRSIVRLRPEPLDLSPPVVSPPRVGQAF